MAVRRRVWFTTSAPADDQFRSMVDGICEECRQRLLSTDSRFQAADSPAQADIILFIESPIHKFRDYGAHLAANELIRAYPERCFAYDWADSPAGFLPGVYPSLPRQKDDPARFRAGGFMAMYNTEVLQHAGAPLETDPEPDLLLAFRGGASDAIRHKLFAIADQFPPDVLVSRSDKWFNYDTSEKDSYARELKRSRYVLCPRGIGTSTFRLYEAMALGRAPVILSDNWISPVGPAWPDFAIQISEDKYALIADIVREYDSEWRERGRIAHAAWKAWFAPDVALLRVLQSVEDIRLRRPASHDEREYQARWTGWQFAYDNGWTMPQKIGIFLKDGTLLKKVRGKLGLNRATA